MIRSLTAAAALLALATPAGAADKSAWKAARPTGAPVSCIARTDIRETRVRDSRTIDFYLRDGRVMRNTLPQSCPMLAVEQRFAYQNQSTINRLCSVDIITVFQVPSLGVNPSCGLGEFQPVTGAPR